MYIPLGKSQQANCQEKKNPNLVQSDSSLTIESTKKAWLIYSSEIKVLHNRPHLPKS